MDLDVDMSNLEINEKKRIANGVFKHELNADKSTSSPELDENTTQLRRSSRKKIRPMEIEKRRVYSKPRKLLDDASVNEVNNYYLDKRIKRLPPSLETIFEEPKGDTFMSVKKFRRCIQFNSQLGVKSDKLRVKKRKLKAKKVKKDWGIKGLDKQVAMVRLQEILSSIEKDEAAISDSKDISS